MSEILGFEGVGAIVWFIWIIPFAGAALIPAIAKAGNRVRDYSAVGFALVSALLAATVIQFAFSGEQIHSQIQLDSYLESECRCVGRLIINRYGQYCCLDIVFDNCIFYWIHAW